MWLELTCDKCGKKFWRWATVAKYLEKINRHQEHYCSVRCGGRKNIKEEDRDSQSLGHSV